MSDKCVFCGYEVSKQLYSGTAIYHCECENCGQYKINDKSLKSLQNIIDKYYKDDKHIISGYIREQTDIGNIITLSSNMIPDIIKSINVPTLSKKIASILLFYYRNTKYFEQPIALPDQPSLFYAYDRQELTHMATALYELGWLKTLPLLNSSNSCLTIAGFNKAESLLTELIERKQVFVAMWFDDKMLNIYNNYISKAISEAYYDPFIISKKEHNNNICDEIISEIRRSRFLIADFTGHRGGVYFEAGFAYGLGKPVIWTCRKDWFNNNPEIEYLDVNNNKVIIKENRQIHFDVDHYNFIIWETGTDLYEQLKNRIEATLPLDEKHITIL